MRQAARGLPAWTAVAMLPLALSGCQPNCKGIVFPNPEESAYLLPYPVGSSYVVSQSYCNARGGHSNRIAVDFMMPLGAEIVAARAGRVVEVVKTYVDGDLRRGHNNRVLIKHDDGSLAWYAHLQHESVVVAVGDTIDSGQRIARCGNTGNTGNLPHLHFEVFRSTPYDYDDAIPVSFRNAKGPRDTNGGLVSGEAYEALAPPGNLLSGSTSR